MNQIAAAENLLIEIAPGRWRLLTNHDTGRRVLVEAAVGEPLRYVLSFATTRRLPEEGLLPVEYIRQVVLGWSNDDEAWHLGLLLARDLADARGSRWCEIASWPDPDRNVFTDLAHDAGDALARTLDRPFNFIPARVRVVEQPPPPPLPSLPLTCGMWKLEPSPSEQGALQFTRSRQWTISRLMRAGWYTIWVAVYIFLSVTTLNTDLALPNAGTMLPNPQLLPYLGLLAAAVLVMMILYTFYEVARTPDRIVVSPQARAVAALRGSAVKWERKADDVQSVYVTQVVNRKGRKRIIYHREINLHLGSGQFHQVIQNGSQDETAEASNPEERAEEGIVRLVRQRSLSEFQAAGLYLAETLGNLPCWYDQRVR